MKANVIKFILCLPFLWLPFNSYYYSPDDVYLRCQDGWNKNKTTCHIEITHHVVPQEDLVHQMYQKDSYSMNKIPTQDEYYDICEVHSDLYPNIKYFCSYREKLKYNNISHIIIFQYFSNYQEIIKYDSYICYHDGDTYPREDYMCHTEYRYIVGIYGMILLFLHIIFSYNSGVVARARARAR